MDGLNHKKLTVSAGHKCHGVHPCRRCGWPFPNPHPSARHRKSHKRVCGTIEGYEIIQSESDDYRLVVSSDVHWSDDNDGTPSPKADKRYEKNFGGSGGVGEKSNPSDDEVFADAVNEFSDGGISPQQVERFEHVKETEKSVELNTVEDDHSGTDINEVDETAGKAGEINYLRNTDPMCNPEALVNAAYQSDDVPLITGTRIEQVSITDSNVLQHALIKTGFLKDASVATVNESGDAERQQGLGMAGLDSDIQKENDRLVSVTLDSVEGKPPNPVLTALGSEEVPCDDLASEVVERDPSLTRMLENIDATAEVKTVANSNQVIGSTRTIANNAVAEEIRENINDPVWITDESDLSVSSVSASESKQTSAAIDVKVKQKASLGNGENSCDSNPSAGEKCHTDENEDGNQEPIVKYSSETVSAHGCETTENLKEGMNHSNEEAESDLSNPENVKCDRAATDIQEVHDSALEERSKVETSSPESINNTSCPTLHEFRMGKVTEVLQELGSAKMDSGLDPVSSSVKFELPNNINVTSNVKGIESGVTDSEILCKSSANVSSGTGNGDISSKSIDCAEVGSERNQNGSSELHADNSRSPTSIIHETFLLDQKYLIETLADVDNEHANYGIASGSTQTCDDDFVPSVLNSEVVHETSATQDDNAEDLSLDSKPLQEPGKVRLIKKNDGVSAKDPSHRLIGRSDSLEGKCGSVSDMSEANLQEPKMTTEEARAETSDVFELPPSMNSTHSGSVVDKLAAASEIEMAQNHQRLKCDHESQGQKINVETIDNVTNWTPEKQQSQLKHLLSEAKSPNTKQATVKNNANKEMEDWDSPMRYPVDTKKGKKKGKPYWVPFVCCSSVHCDL